jgi:galactose mutarotase-like enzyme
MKDYRVEKSNTRGLDRIINFRDECTVTLTRFGGEVIGYNVFDSRHKKDLPIMWRNNQMPSPTDGSWKNHATILFPIVGGLVNKQSRLGDTVIKTKGNHGFPRHSLFALADAKAEDDKAWIHYQLMPDEEIRGYYPFEFMLDLVYTLRGNVLTLDFSVTNEEPHRDLWFCLGWHPGFNTDWGLGGKKHDWQIIFRKGDYIRHLVNADCQLLGETKKEHFDGHQMWDEKELEGTVLLSVDKTENRSCALYNPQLKCGVRVDFPDYPHFGLWSQAGQPFFCLEPWQGMDDHAKQEPFEKKVGVVKLAPGKKRTWRASITPLLG